MILIAIVLHFSNAIGDLGSGILPGLIGTTAAVFVNIYLNDFAWTIGEMYLTHKPRATNSLLEGLIAGIFSILGVLYYFLLRSYNVSIWFYAYLIGLFLLAFYKRNNSIVTSGLIVCITMIQKYISLIGYSSWVSIILQGVLFYIALDRQGK